MGRRGDKFSWAQVEKSKDGTRWKCRHCDLDYAGTSATRIRNHLSGQGNDIKACEKVPENVKKEAGLSNLSRLSVGRRKSRVGTDITDGICASAVDPVVSNIPGSVTGGSLAAAAHDSSAVVAVTHAVGADLRDHDITFYNTDAAAADANVALRGWETEFQDVLLETGRWKKITTNNVTTATSSDYDITGLIAEFGKDDLFNDIEIGMNEGSRGKEISKNPREDYVCGVTSPAVAQAAHIVTVAPSRNYSPSSDPRESKPSLHINHHEEERPAFSSWNSSNSITGHQKTRAMKPLANSATENVSKQNTKKGVRGEEDVQTYALHKFLMCTKSCSSNPLEFVMDPLFQEFVESIVQHGVPYNLLRGDSSLLNASTLRIKHELEDHMLVVTRSWKTTGCTSMLFNLQKCYENNSDYDNDSERIVIAVYCPKGLFFVEALDSDCIDDDDYYYTESLKRHSPKLCIDESVQWLRHRDNDESDNKCMLNHMDRWRTPRVGEAHCCLWNEIQKSCDSICEKSEWAKSLIGEAAKIRDYLRSNDDPWYGDLFMKGDQPLPKFLSIIAYHRKKHPSGYMKLTKADLEEITEGSKFWNEGRKLKLILKCVMKIANVMNTLVPTAGYYGMALDKVDSTIQRCGERLGEHALRFWRNLKSKLERDTKSSRLAASYLNPEYFVQKLEEDPKLPARKLKRALTGFAELQGVQLEQIDKEVKMYAEIFRDLPPTIQLRNIHPVKLWEKLGSRLPTLYRCAAMLLSRPLCCMSKQVKEHSHSLRYSDDYILKLNLRVKQHFERLGDGIYKPLDLSDLDYEKAEKYIQGEN